MLAAQDCLEVVKSCISQTALGTKNIDPADVLQDLHINTDELLEALKQRTLIAASKKVSGEIIKKRFLAEQEYSQLHTVQQAADCVLMGLQMAFVSNR